MFKWLKQFPKQALQQIRQLDLVVHREDIRPSTSVIHTALVVIAWTDLIKFVKSNLNVDKLCLSIDLHVERRLRSALHILYHRFATANNWLMDLITKELGRPAKCRVYLVDGYPPPDRLAASLERRVMGASYYSSREGKIPAHAGCEANPHLHVLQFSV